jgi:hypothetical protein
MWGRRASEFLECRLYDCGRITGDSEIIGQAPASSLSTIRELEALSRDVLGMTPRLRTAFLEKLTGAHVWRMLECLQSCRGRTTKSHLAGRHR